MEEDEEQYMINAVQIDAKQKIIPICIVVEQNSYFLNKPDDFLIQFDRYHEDYFINGNYYRIILRRGLYNDCITLPNTFTYIVPQN